ncbi:TetR/AcrR family transcriptional regulator [Actinomycetes bacterium M1A6_2h]
MTDGRPYRGVSPKDRDDRRRSQLLEAGLNVFGTVGFRNATVRGLCREAKVADRNFYELFPSTEDLLVAVYRDCIDRLMTATVDAMSALPADSDVDTVARSGLDAFFSVCEDDKFAQTVWMEVLGVSDRVNKVYLGAMESFGHLMLARLDGVSGDERHGLATAAVGGISHLAMTWHLGGYITSRANVVDAATLFLTSLAKGSEPEQK